MCCYSYRSYLTDFLILDVLLCSTSLLFYLLSFSFLFCRRYIAAWLLNASMTASKTEEMLSKSKRLISENLWNNSDKNNNTTTTTSVVVWSHVALSCTEYFCSCWLAKLHQSMISSTHFCEVPVPVASLGGVERRRRAVWHLPGSDTRVKLFVVAEFRKNTG